MQLFIDDGLVTVFYNTAMQSWRIEGGIYGNRINEWISITGSGETLEDAVKDYARNLRAEQSNLR